MSRLSTPAVNTVEAIGCQIKANQTDDNEDINKTSNAVVSKSYSIKTYICCYLLISMYLGAFYSIPSAVFAPIQRQLNISTKEIGLLWSVYDITYGISAVASGIIADLAYKSTHIYISVFICVSLVGLCTMSLVENYFVMVVVWILLSYSLGVFDSCNAILIYKLFAKADNATTLLTIATITSMIVMTAFLPLIDLSLVLFNTYSYSMYVLAILAIPSFILMVIFPPRAPIAKTPQTTKELDEINLSLDKIDSSSGPETDTGSSNDTLQSKKREMKLFVVINMCLMAGFQSQNVMYSAYISIYSIQFLQTSEQIALYFVTAFFSGMTVGRFVTVYVLKKYRADNVLLLCCSGMFVDGLLFLLLHLLYDNKMINLSVYKIMLYFVLIFAGFSSSSVLNGSYAFLSLIQPMTGFINSLLFVGYCSGGAITAFVVGTLVDEFDAKIIPFAVAVQLFVCLITATIIQKRFTKYQKKLIPKNLVTSLSPIFQRRLDP